MSREWEAVVEELGELVGVERDLHSVNSALKLAARRIAAPVTGAMHIRCSDEAERESVESFQKVFSEDLLPRLKFATHSAFSTSSLGGQYEWGSLAVAERNFAAPASRDRFKLMVVKVNAHCGVTISHGARSYGVLRRYEIDKPCCGLLTGLLAGGQGPSIRRAADAFESEGVDRLGMLRHEVDPQMRLLAAAIVEARLQARSAVIEAQEFATQTPTLFLIVPSVTLNQADRDAELVCGFYLIDRRAGGATECYQGLGDVPTEYVFEEQFGQIRVTDPGVAEARPARDHRRLILDALREPAAPELARDERIDEILQRAEAETLEDEALRSVLLKGLLVALAELSPVAAALVLFAEGGAGVYHVWRSHRMVRDVGASDEARAVLADLERRVDRMPPEEVEKILRVLLARYAD